jgi:fucose permease
MHFSSSFIILVIGMVVLNAGIAMYQISTNTLFPVLFISYQALLMNLLHFCYGFGEAAGQRITGIMLERGIQWRSLYLIDAIIFVVLFIVLQLVKLPSISTEKSLKEKAGLVHILRNKMVLLYIGALGFYVFSELSVSSWFVNYLKTTYAFDNNRSSFYLAAFFTVFTLGRLVGGFIVEKAGKFKSLLFFLPTAAVMFTVGLILGEKAVIFISASGFFFSIAYPTIVVTINSVFKNNTSVIMSTILTFASAVNMLMNMVMGGFNDVFGAYASFFMIPGSLLISIILIFSINRKLSTEK